MIEDLLFLSLIICCGYITVKLCLSYVKVIERLRYMEGQFEIMRNVPVLRQYVKEFVPVEITPEREKEIMQKMQEQAEEWQKMYGFEPEQAKPFPRIDKMMPEKDLV